MNLLPRRWLTRRDPADGRRARMLRIPGWLGGGRLFPRRLGGGRLFPRRLGGGRLFPRRLGGGRLFPRRLRGGRLFPRRLRGGRLFPRRLRGGWLAGGWRTVSRLIPSRLAAGWPFRRRLFPSGWAPGWMARRWVDRWVRLDRPRRTVRLRLTLMYGGLFLLSGTGLLIFTYVLVAHRLPLPVQTTHRVSAGGGAGGVMIESGSIGSACTPNPALAAPGQLTQCATEAQAALASQRTGELNDLLIKSGIALAIMAVLSIGLGWLVGGRVLRPLRTITTTARRLSASSLHERLALAGPDDELKELGDTFDGLLARLEASFSAQRQFVANASHELRTPLARQRTLVEVALADPEPTVASLTEACGRVLAAGEQQERLIEALLTLARSQRGLDSRQSIALASVAEAAVRSRLAEAEGQGISLSTELDSSPIMGDARLAERLVANLMDNALRHNVPGGWVHVFTGTHDGEAVLAVVNSSAPVAPEEVRRLFEPFQRLDAGRVTGRDGLGLGLSIVRAIAEAHHARVSVRSLPEGGLDVQVRFPRRPPVPPPPRPARTGPLGTSAG